MILVNSDIQSHNVKLIPRFTPSTNLDLFIKNEFTKDKTELVVSNYTYDKGYFNFSFDFDFMEKLTYEFKIKEGDRVLFIGKFKAVAFQLDTNNEFNYELNFSF